MDPLLAIARKKQKDIITFVKELAECESPSDSPEAIGRFTALLEDRLSEIGTLRRLRGGHVQIRFDLPGGKKTGQVLALGHSDTVYPIGTLATMPVRESRGRLYGPGVFDMKTGIAMFAFAIRILREQNISIARNVVMQLNSDEEIGSESSRPITEREAGRSVAVLVLEPAQGPEGLAKTQRKGVGDYVVTVRGRSAHAGLDFTDGASAIVEAAKQIEKMTAFTDLDRGITVNPGVITGGSRTNVIADYARIEVDVRIVRAKDAGMLDRKFRSLKAYDKRCSLEVTGGINRPPMEKSKASAGLFSKAQRVALELGFTLNDTLSGGGSDGNFTAARGVPTLDGIGAIGEGAHSPNECIYTDRVAERTAFLAKLLQVI